MKFLIFFTLILFTATGYARQSEQTTSKKIHQLRIYEIFDHNKDAFHRRFNDHALRIMKSYNFHILGMWEAKADDKTKFIYLLEWPDTQTMESSWSKFMADEEWKNIKQETGKTHGVMVGEIEDIRMNSVPYFPTSGLSNHFIRDN